MALASFSVYEPTYYKHSKSSLPSINSVTVGLAHNNYKKKKKQKMLEYAY